MALFIDVKIEGACQQGCKACVEACPVDIFTAKPVGNQNVSVLGENEDECTLCDICLERCPVHIIKINKKY